MKRVLIYVAFVSLTLVPMAHERFRLTSRIRSVPSTAGAGGWYVSGTVTVTFQVVSGGRVGG